MKTKNGRWEYQLECYKRKIRVDVIWILNSDLHDLCNLAVIHSSTLFFFNWLLIISTYYCALWDGTTLIFKKSYNQFTCFLYQILLRERLPRDSFKTSCFIAVSNWLLDAQTKSWLLRLFSKLWTRIAVWMSIKCSSTNFPFDILHNVSNIRTLFWQFLSFGYL